MTLSGVTYLLLVWTALVHGQIPSLRSFTKNESEPSFVLRADTQIIVDAKHQGDLLSYASTFHEDLVSVTGFTQLPNVAVGNGTSSSTPLIFLSVNVSASHNLFNGNSTGEGYDLHILQNSYIIEGHEALGTWWGTRTFLQQVVLALSNGSSSDKVAISSGFGSDAPGWEVRGFMLDAGRHWFEPSFLADLCVYASFFKIQELHLHASDNLWNPDFLYGQDWRKLYSGFRFQPPESSSIAGLVPLRNESWSMDEFRSLQSTCTAHGITIVPEIDTPGHSLGISKWKEGLMISGEPDHLNLSHPDTIPTIKSIWDEFLPWFSSPEVSIGADEYDASLADDYISFVNEMSSHVSSQGNKSIRVWGTNEPSNTSSISKDVTIQHWNFPGDSIPVQLLEQGYRVINSEQHFLYLDGKTSDNGQFPTELNPEVIWRGAPGGNSWASNIFSPDDASNNTSLDHLLLRGSIMALWNDWGNNATTPLEIYYQLAKSLALFAEKTWAGPDGVTQDEFERVYPVLNAAAPGQNLNRAIPGRRDGDIVFEYGNLETQIQTDFESVGPPYTLSFSVRPNDSTSDGIIFAGRDSVLHTHSLSFEDPSTKVIYSLNYTLPRDSLTRVEIHATREYTYALFNDSSERHWWTTELDIWGGYMKAANMSFAAPSQVLRGDGFDGELRDVLLRLEA